MIDLLLPPAGKSLRVISFTGWSPDADPACEDFAAVGEGQVEKLGDEFRADFGVLFTEMLSD